MGRWLRFTRSLHGGHDMVWQTRYPSPATLTAPLLFPTKTWAPRSTPSPPPPTTRVGSRARLVSESLPFTSRTYSLATRYRVRRNIDHFV